MGLVIGRHQKAEMEVLETKNIDSQFNKFHRQLMPYAYNIIGDSSEAEDVVQEILNNYFMTSSDHVQNPVNYLTRAVINRAITAKKKLNTRRAHYYGQWLPGPIQTEDVIYQQVDKNRILSYSLMVLLERLSPKERAVFILKESFDFQHDEIAKLLDITVENSRQLFKRAHQKLERNIKRSVTATTDARQTLQELTTAILQADVEKVKTLLAEDVHSFSDGGSKHRSAPNIIHGRHNVTKFLQANFGKYFLEGSAYSFTLVNHSPAIVIKSADGQVYKCLIPEIIDGVIVNVYIVVNPDKLNFVK